MPVTAKLSKLFYDRLGEQIANELVEWFNQVDATYRADLKDFNELNFARFDAKLEQRLAELRAELLSELHGRITRLEAKLDTSMANQREWVEKTLREQTRWFFVAWATLLASNIGLWFR